MTLRKISHALVWAYRHVTGKMRVPEIESIAEYINQDSVCLDVGAHGGSWSCGLARLVPDGHIYSFEALPYYADVLGKTLKILRQNNVTLLNRAVAEEEGAVQMSRQDREGNTVFGKTHVAVSSEADQKMDTIQTITLDSFWQGIDQKKVDFVKCDVEGFELFVLRGAKSLIEQCRPVFYNELNSEWCERYDYTPADIFRFFQERNYKAFYLDQQQGMIPVDEEKHVNRDVLFLPEERVGH